MNQLREMLELQKKLNDRISDNWYGNAHLRAANHEVIEAQEHIGWKWWKKQEPNLPQAQIEMVDAWHFILSHFLAMHRGDVDSAYEALIVSLHPDTPINPAVMGRFLVSDILGKLDVLSAMFAAGGLSAILFSQACEELGLSLPLLHRMYIAKNVLNVFRQDNGYKVGTYRKLWEGEEDNVHLERILDAVPNVSFSVVYDALSEKYHATRGH